MTIEVTDDILNQKVSETNRKNYKNYIGDNAKSWDKYRKEIAETSKEFQDLVTIANNNGIDLEWDKQGKLTQKCREELVALNLKYAEGTKAAELYARAQEAEARATNYSADASVRAAEAKRKEMLIERERLLNSTDSRDVLMGLMGYQDLDNDPKDKVTKKNYIDPDSTNSLKVWMAELDKERNKLDQNSVTAGKYSAKKKALANSQVIVNAKTKAATTSLNMQAGALKIGAAAANLAGKAMRFFGFESATAMVKALGPTIALTAALWGIQKVIEIVSEHAPTLSNLKEQATESSQAFEEAKGKVESLDSELQTTKDRIEELKSAGPLNFTEQSELERLEKQNAELEKQLSIERAIADEKERQATEDNYEVIEKMNKAPVGRNTTKSSKYYDPNRSWIGNDLNVKIEKYKAELAKLEKMEVDLNDDKSLKKWEDQKEMVDEYKTVAIEAFEEINTELDEINPELLDESQLAIYKEVMALRDKLYLSTGDLNMDTAMKSALGTEQYDVVIAKMQELANSKKEINADTIKEIFSPAALAQLEEVGMDLPAIVEHIQKLRGVEGALDVAISDSGNADQIKKNIDNMISSADLEIDASAVEKALGEDVVKACEKAGYSIDILVGHFKELQDEADNTSFKSAIDDIKSLKDNLAPLSDAVNEFRENNSVSIDTLSGLSDSIWASMEGFDEFINVLSDSGSTMEDVESSAGALVEAYFNQADALGGLTQENAALYEQELKRLGIANSNEIVQYQLAKATLTNANATREAKVAAWEHIQALGMANNALSANAMAALTAGDMTEYFAAQESLAAGNNFAEVVNSHANALYSVANAAGPAARNLAEYANIAIQLSSIQRQVLSTKSIPKLLSLGGQAASLMGRAASLGNKAYSEFLSISKPKFQFGGGYTGASSGGSGGGGSSGGGSGGGRGGSGKNPAQDAADKRDDAYKKAKDLLDHQLEMNFISYSKYYKKLVALGNKYYKDKKGRVYKKNREDWRDHLEELAKVREQAYDKAKDSLDKSLEDGKININTYHKKITALQKKWLKGRKSNAEKLKEEIEELYDKVFEHYEDKLDKTFDWIEDQDFYKTWAPGEDAVTTIRGFIDELTEQLKTGKLKWKDYYELIRKLRKREKEAQIEQWESQKGYIDELVDMVSEMLKQEKEDMIDALEKQLDRYREICEAKKESLDATRAELDYQRELSDANKELSEMQAKAAVLKLDTSREGQAKYKALMEEIAQKQLEIADKQDEHAYDATIEGIDKALEKYEEKIEKKIEDIEDLMKNQGEWLKYVYSYINNTDPSKLLEQLKKYNDVYGTGIAQDVTDLWENYQNAVGQYSDKKIEEIIALLRQQIKNSQNAEEDPSGSSENYETIGSMIAKMKANSEKMKGLDPKSEEYQKLFDENTKLAEKISDESKGEYDNLRYDASTGKWYTKTGVDLYKKISDKGRTAVTIKNEMMKAKTAAEKNALAAELRQIAGYEDVFYDQGTKTWYKNMADFKAQIPLLGKDTTSPTFEKKPDKIIESLRASLAAGNMRAVRELMDALRSLGNEYKEIFYWPKKNAVYKSAKGFSNGLALAGKGGGTSPTAADYIDAMKNSNSGAANDALAVYLRKFKGYEGVYYNKEKKKWYKSKNAKTPLYHTGLKAGFVGDDYSPTPKQNELYALLKKGELVLNKSDQDRLAVQMQVLSTMSDSLRKMNGNMPNITNNSSADIVLNVEAPLIINGNADETLVKAMHKHGDIVADKALNKITEALEIRGYSMGAKNNVRKR